MELRSEEVRVLGCLVEKEATTPEAYPLSTNALLLACNQRTSRDPVVDYDEGAVNAALISLRDRGLARTSRGAGSRVYKHAHLLPDALGLSAPELAVLSVLMLRGPQTPGELRSRTERQHGFATVGEVEDVLAALAARAEPLVAKLARRPGQKETRWAHLLGGGEPAPAPGEPLAGVSPEDELPGLLRELEELRARLERLEAKLRGLSPET